MDASAPSPAAAHGVKKRPIELVGRPEFMAREDDGAYHVLEMPKRHRCDSYAAANKPRRRARRSHLLMTNATADVTEKKRELDEPEAFVAEEESGGAYAIANMPKKYKFESMADPERAGSPLANRIDADHARSLAMLFRLQSVGGKYRAELQAMAAARRND